MWVDYDVPNLIPILKNFRASRGNKRGRGEGAAQKSGHRAIYFISQILG
jgi:hypothetical protein